MRDIALTLFILGLLPFVLARAWVGVLLWTWIPILALDANATKALSIREDDSRGAARGLLVGSATASLIGVMCALLAAKRTDNRTLEILLTTGNKGRLSRPLALAAHKQGHQRVGSDLSAPVTVNAGIETRTFRQGVG